MDYEDFVKALEEDEMKTKHLKRKAEKKEKTRSIKRRDAKRIDSIKEGLRRRVDRIASDTLKNIASHSEAACTINKYRGQIRQILS